MLEDASLVWEGAGEALLGGGGGGGGYGGGGESGGGGAGVRTGGRRLPGGERDPQVSVFGLCATACGRCGSAAPGATAGGGDMPCESSSLWRGERASSISLRGVGMCGCLSTASKGMTGTKPGGLPRPRDVPDGGGGGDVGAFTSSSNAG